jgi:hypothetical protein
MTEVTTHTFICDSCKRESELAPHEWRLRGWLTAKLTMLDEDIREESSSSRRQRLLSIDLCNGCQGLDRYSWILGGTD